MSFLLSRGKQNDIYMAQTFLEYFDLNGKIIFADKGYGRDSFVRCIEQRGGIALIPSRIGEKTPGI